MEGEIISFSFPWQEQEMIEEYLNYQVPYDDLVKELNIALKIRWEETFLEFLVSQHEIYRDNLNLLIFKKCGVPVAFLCYSEEKGKVFVSYLLVLPSFRRQGIGRQLFERLLEDNPSKSQHLICPQRQGPAEIFYSSIGFQRDPEGVVSKSLWFVKPAYTEVNHDLSREYRPRT